MFFPAADRSCRNVVNAMTTAIIKSFATAKFLLGRTSTKFQTSNLQTARGRPETGSLKILWRLEFGIWSFSVR
jgi:hypothetical protein